MRTRQVVLGVDSSTQSTKVLAVDVDSGEIVGTGRASHTGADTQDPRDWWTALRAAAAVAVDDGVDVVGISVGGQQHGLVTLDADGEPVRPAPLWNNLESAVDAERLNGLADFAAEVGTWLVASLTITKLAHLARMVPADLARTAAVCLPHDYLNLKLTGRLTSDRSEASGSGWWSPSTGELRRDLVALAVGPDHAERLSFPTVLGPSDEAGIVSREAAAFLDIPAGIPVGPGAGDNPAAALGIGAGLDELCVSLGTSGVAYAVSDQATHDPSGEVAGFADATGRFLPLTCMLNCTRVLDATADMLGVDRVAALDRAGAVEPGARGLLLMPYLAGERTPNLPHASGAVIGMTAGAMRPELLLRAAVDGVAAGIGYCVEALGRSGVSRRLVTLVGGGAQHATWRQAIADVTGLPVQVRSGGEHVALGAAFQIASLVRDEPLPELTARWRPPSVFEAEPRPDHRAGFNLDRRRAMIATMKAEQTVP